MKHTLTPWSVVDADTRDTAQLIIGEVGQPIADVFTMDRPGECEANAERIVECVNLFHDIEDPTGYMKNINAMLLKAGDAVNENERLREEIVTWRQERDGLREQVHKLSELTGQLTPSGLSGKTSSHTELSNESTLFPEAEIQAHRLAELSAGANAEDTRDTTTPIAAEELPSGMTDGLRFLRKKIEETQDQVNAVRREIRGLREQQTAISNQIATEFLRLEEKLSKGSSANRLFRSDASVMLNKIVGLTLGTDYRATIIYRLAFLTAVLVAIDFVIHIVQLITK